MAVLGRARLQQFMSILRVLVCGGCAECSASLRGHLEHTTSVNAATRRALQLSCVMCVLYGGHLARPQAAHGTYVQMSMRRSILM